MNRIDNSGTGLARLGRDEDQYMAHVAQGEMVVPPVISPETRQRIEQELRAAGLSPDEYKVGEGMSINPITGMPEFGWLKKTFKSIKKVAKKVAPVIGPLANFIPGVGPLMSAAIGAGTTKLAGGSWKDALKAGAFSYGAGKLGGGIGGLKGKPTGGNFFGNAKEFLFKGKDGVGLFGNLGKGIGGLKDRAGEFLFKGDDGVGLFGNTIGKGYEYVMPGKDGIGLFGNVFGTGQGTEYEIQPGDNLTKIAQESGVTVEELMKANGITDPNMIQAGAKLTIPGSSGGFNIGRNILGKGNTPDFIKGIEDRLKGPDGQFGGGDGLFSGGGSGGGIGNLGIAGISALLGKMAYDSAKDRMGGLAATPAVTMDSLGRYSLSKALGTGGTREEFGLPAAQESLKFNMGGPVQYFSQGGAAIKELDMRNGGESAGPGTGTSDDIPAMLSDGEFVMTAKATRGAGAFGMNKTKSGIELVKGGKASRKKGVENMRELMNIFEAI
jgi:LysM repeat protein